MEALGLRVHDALDPAAADRACYASGVCVLGTRKAAAAIEHNDGVVSGQGDRILDRGITGSDYDDGLSTQCICRLERVLHARQIASWHVDSTWMSLHAERENNILPTDGFTGLDGNLETAARTSDGRDFSAVLYVDIGTLDAALPGLQDALTAARRELQV